MSYLIQFPRISERLPILLFGILYRVPLSPWEVKMAQQLLVELVDDLDGTTSADIRTVTFGLDGVDYEIDLTEQNAAVLRAAFEEFVERARRTGGRRQRGTRPAGTGSGPDAAAIRAWAQTNGVELAARGRIPAHVNEAYQEAMATPPSAKTRTKTPAKAKSTSPSKGPSKAKSQAPALKRTTGKTLPDQPTFTSTDSQKAVKLNQAS
jgi:nucleoid-associated protein Lsr2